MRSYLKRLAVFFGSISAVPLGAGAITAFSFGLGLTMIFLVIPVAALVLLIGTVVFLVEGIRRSRQSGNRRDKVFSIIASPMLCIVTIIVAWPLLWTGSWVGDLTRLGLNHNHYEAIIEKAPAQRHAGWYAVDGGVTYIVDFGPPVRVAFNPEGMLDNWSGIIFDPTGEVMMAKGFDASGRFYAPDRVTKLFGGDLVSCRHLWGNYYTCSFT